MDKEALKTLYKSCYPKILKYVLQNSGTTADAEDALQHTMLALLSRNAALPDIENVEAYVFTAAKRQFVRIHLRQKQQEQVNTPATETEMYVAPKTPFEAVDNSFQPDQSLEYQEMLKLAWRNIRALPKQHQRLIELSITPPPHTLKEISELLNIKYQTAKAQRSKAFSTLRNALQQQGVTI